MIWLTLEQNYLNLPDKNVQRNPILGFNCFKFDKNSINNNHKFIRSDENTLDIGFYRNILE